MILESILEGETKKKRLGAEEMAQWSRKLVSIAEDLGGI